ncbi:hypothetical protein [Parathalassolituus penaei]
MTETDGKATGWSAWYNDSKWIEETCKKSRKKVADDAGDE